MPDQAQPAYYTDAVYHLNFPGVAENINQAITGHPYRGWMQRVIDLHGNLGRVLALNCGNGWVERELFSRGGCTAVLGVDISEALLAEARAGAAGAGMPAEYRIMDSNAPDLEPGMVDSVVNHAALHHVTRLDGMVRALCRALPEQGLLINYDYVGPHRNQYPWEVWSRVLDLWGEIPETLRCDLVYPHYRTMLKMDPSEAVHSDLILGTVQRYFTVEEERGLDGAIAYPLLFGQHKLLAAIKRGEQLPLLERILAVDREWSRGEASRSFFAFQICRPGKAVLADEAQLATWTEEEDRREQAAAAAAGRYGDVTPLERIYGEMTTLRDRLTSGRF